VYDVCRVEDGMSNGGSSKQSSEAARGILEGGVDGILASWVSSKQRGMAI
jgi:hypothetical protein